MADKYLTLKPYYQWTFKLFDEASGTKTVKWNWAAAFFGPFWALSKGLVKNGFLFLLLGIALAAAGGVPAGALFIYYGCRGNWLYYKKVTENNDLWA